MKDINFVKTNSGGHKEFIFWFEITTMLLSLMIIAIAVFHTIKKYQYSTLCGQNIAVQKKIALLESAHETTHDFATLEKKLAKLNNRARAQYVTALTLLHKQIQSTMDLDSFSFKKNDMQTSIRAKKSQSIMSFLRSMNQSEAVKEMKLTSMQMVNNTIKATIKGLIKE
jgi:Tfp pilus assembly protein PilN